MNARRLTVLALLHRREHPIFNGQIQVPVLTLHTTGDGLVPVQDEQAYASVVQAAGHGSLLRELFVHRANHCSFTAAETITAFQTLVQRLDSGTWQHSDDARSLPPPCLSRSPPRDLHKENQKTVYPPSVL